MKIKTEKAQQKNFEPFNVIIVVEDVVDLGVLYDLAFFLKNGASRVEPFNEVGLFLKAAIDNHIGRKS